MQVETDAPRSGRLAAAEARLASSAPGYLDRVRDLVDRLAVHDADDTDARAALSAVDALAIIDIDAPTVSRIPAARLVKKAVKQLVAWYLRYFGRQLAAFGEAVSHLGGILVDRTDRLESGTVQIRAELARLADRVERLEGGGSGRL